MILPLPLKLLKLARLKSVLVLVGRSGDWIDAVCLLLFVSPATFFVISSFFVTESDTTALVVAFSSLIGCCTCTESMLLDVGVVDDFLRDARLMIAVGVFPALSIGSGLLTVSSDLISLDELIDDVDLDSLGRCDLMVDVVVVDAEFLMA